MDADTFKKVFLPYHQKLYRIAYRIVQDVSNAEDIIQDTYVKLWNCRNDLTDVINTEAFAIATLRNTCFDFLRKTKKEQYSTYDTDIPETVSLLKQIEVNDEANLVKTLINELPEQQRIVIMLKHWDGYSDQEIEEATGLNPGNIRVILSRARKTIREQFLKNGQQWNLAK
ncbi:MAG: RNA polymerase sigma factor [Prevotella sp.]|jgi:RNA polymerase sigma-70 factor (ECF subfamily)|nr:RNA polymerase sigma factor [Prevotella sp.]